MRKGVIHRLAVDLTKTDYRPRFNRQRVFFKGRRHYWDPLKKLESWKGNLQAQGARHQNEITHKYRRSTSYYRNLAIQNGADPDDMLDAYDATVCKMYPNMSAAEWANHRVNSEGEDPY